MRLSAVWSTSTMNNVDVRFVAGQDRAPLVRMLETSDDFPQTLLQYYWRPSSRDVTLAAWCGRDIVGVLKGSFDSDFEESGAFDSFNPPPAPHAFLDRVHVHESTRGAGVGRALVRKYVEEALARGCTFVGGQVDLASDSTARRAFFERLGFSIRALDNFGARPLEILQGDRT